MKQKEDNIIVKKTFEFSCNILDLYSKLIEIKKFRIADQLCRSGTSIGANVREAQRAVSRADFINKMGIALKEAEETQYWFELTEAKIFEIDNKVKNDLSAILKILTSIINSSKN